MVKPEVGHRIHMTEAGMCGYCGQVCSVDLDYSTGELIAKWREKREANTNAELEKMLADITCIACQKTKKFARDLAEIGAGPYWPYAGLGEYIDATVED